MVRIKTKTMKKNTDSDSAPLTPVNVRDSVSSVSDYITLIPGSALFAKFSSPYEIGGRLGDTDYAISNPRTQASH